MLQPEVRGDGASSSALIPSSPLSSVESTVGIRSTFWKHPTARRCLAAWVGTTSSNRSAAAGWARCAEGLRSRAEPLFCCRQSACSALRDECRRKTIRPRSSGGRCGCSSARSGDPLGRCVRSVAVSRHATCHRRVTAGSIAREGLAMRWKILRIGSQAARRTAGSATGGLVHWDIKPGNILLERGASGEEIMLTDFGLLSSRRRCQHDSQRNHCRHATVHVAPNRLLAGDSIDHRSDLFSLGSVLYDGRWTPAVSRLKQRWGC